MLVTSATPASPDFHGLLHVQLFPRRHIHGPLAEIPLWRVSGVGWLCWAVVNKRGLPSASTSYKRIFTDGTVSIRNT